MPFDTKTIVLALSRWEASSRSSLAFQEVDIVMILPKSSASSLSAWFAVPSSCKTATVVSSPPSAGASKVIKKKKEVSPRSKTFGTDMISFNLLFPRHEPTACSLLRVLLVHYCGYCWLPSCVGCDTSFPHTFMSVTTAILVGGMLMLVLFTWMNAG
eukprot:Protomagalhaensia_wolfi_Nauph_80__5877@NODE_757_length_2025_cov_42_759315_g403_i2_p1_GENE_NODE_757_length_2025_cov_42_759315_g403_i2NODE_757_length_2025_cov_42_759315_g403_i2_p1_ORF_typecomplete_len157_score11_24P5ATPase/PF12409_8/16P5ATPase/PF12409_8/3_6_NODE_757_length_2025_cov_42_759315_g403_i2171641